ncbi:unnamed protein product [Mytilus edulis]|uniref:DZIP3-like HEPN domain-containing protein n=1 Tax=Mytilus edulis TaxID=6550 RepID=A0A8S3SL03_MYTED|nr:unnamed protein product [Mytilus edulis]
MATSISAGETYYLRIANLLLKVAPSAVRVKFDKEFYPSGLQTVLNQKRLKIQGLTQKKIINIKQWNLLFPSSGKAISSTFDVTLMTCLLRNLAKINIQDNLPLSTDTSEEAALSRIKFYRNEIAHNESGTLTEQLFHQYWGEIIVHTSLLEEWSTIDGKVVPTKAFQRILELLEEEHVLTVIGPPGCGKSTAIHHAALQLRDQKDYLVVPVNFPGEIIQYYNPECKQVFVYDDICGKYAINHQMLDNWCVQSNAIQVILSSTKVKILSSCRSYIFKDRCFSKIKLLSEVHFDVTSENYALSEKERSLIAEVYLSTNEVTALQISNIFTKYDFFPLLCQLYSLKESGDVVVYFSDPIDAINVELESLMNETDQTTFATLFLFVIYNNCIDETIFNQKVKIRNTLLDLSDHFEISSVLSITVVKLQLKKLINSFVKKCENSYSIIHDKIFDILVLFCGNKYFDLCLEVAHTDIIRDRFQLVSLNAEESEGIIVVASEKENSYFDRISNDIRDGFIANVFTNSQMKYISYQQKIIAHLKTNEGLLNIVLSLSEKESSPLLTVANQGFNYLVHSLIEIGLSVNVRDEIGRSALFLATDSNHTETVDLLLNKAANPDLCNNKQISPLHMACLNENVQIVKLLVNSKCNINVRNDYQQTPLFFASFVGHTEIVEFLLENKCDININSKNNNTPLHAACYFDNVEVVQLLLDFKCDPNISSVYNESPLFVACLRNSILSTELLLEKEGNYERILAVVNELVINGANPNHYDYYTEPPMIIATRRFFYEIVQILLENNGDPNITNFEGKTCLHVASENGDLEMVKILLENHADPNVIDNNSISPLCVASKSVHFNLFDIYLARHGYLDDDQILYSDQLALQKQCTELVNVLLIYEADPLSVIESGFNII